jgi:hypothetical protein
LRKKKEGIYTPLPQESDRRSSTKAAYSSLSPKNAGVGGTLEISEPKVPKKPPIREVAPLLVFEAARRSAFSGLTPEKSILMRESRPPL